MIFMYICDREISHVEPAKLFSKAYIQARKSHPSGRFYQKLAIVSAAHWGETLLFFTLLVLIPNHISEDKTGSRLIRQIGSNSEHRLSHVVPPQKSRSACQQRVLETRKEQRPTSQRRKPEYIRIGPSGLKIVVIIGGSNPGVA